MARYSYDAAILNKNGEVRKEYREKPGKVRPVPGVRRVQWDGTIGRHVMI